MVMIDETMFNHKVKAHRGRGTRRQNWCLVIVDCSTSSATGYAEMIEN
jgi:hypothetical protein